MARLLLIFLDGVGLGESDPVVNPLMAARLPTLMGLLEGRRPVSNAAPWSGRQASLVGLDALLGLPGLPQSGTGQAALLTGRNAAALFGRHFGPWTPTMLRPLVANENLLVRAVRTGGRAAFANAYPERLFERAQVPGVGNRLPLQLRIGPSIAAQAAGLLTRHTAELARGAAVASEITNDAWRERIGRRQVPAIRADRAGRNLARIANEHDLTLFAHYTTDHAGHRGSFADAVTALERVDAFLHGVVEALAPDVLVLVASDHGNIEDVRVGHTRNPALALAVGPGHLDLVGDLRSLTDVAPAVLAYLGFRIG